MILYHGSKYLFSEIDLTKSKAGKDFGKGFYLTTNEKQAIKWATRTGSGYIYKYEFDEALLRDETYCVIALTKYNKEWADFVYKCRMFFFESNADIIYDRMADSRSQILTKALDKYGNAEISLEHLLLIAKFSNKNYDQYCFKTPSACNALRRLGVTAVRR